MSQRIVRIEGGMTNSEGDVCHVKLDAAVAELPRIYEVEDAQIVSLDIASDSLNPVDGEYTLYYFFEKPAHVKVRVKSGRLVFRLPFLQSKAR
jgi:hypothetical protein